MILYLTIQLSQYCNLFIQLPRIEHLGALVFKSMQHIYLCFPCCLLLLWWTQNQIPYSSHKNSLDLPHFPGQPYFLNQAQTRSPPPYIPVIPQVTKSWWLVHISNEILAPFTNNCSISQGIFTFCGSVLFLQLNLYLRARTLLFVFKTLQNLKSYRELICCCETYKVVGLIPTT